MLVTHKNPNGISYTSTLPQFNGVMVHQNGKVEGLKTYNVNNTKKLQYLYDVNKKTSIQGLLTRMAGVNVKGCKLRLIGKVICPKNILISVGYTLEDAINGLAKPNNEELKELMRQRSIQYKAVYREKYGDAIREKKEIKKREKLIQYEEQESTPEYKIIKVKGWKTDDNTFFMSKEMAFEHQLKVENAQEKAEEVLNATGKNYRIAEIVYLQNIERGGYVNFIDVMQSHNGVVEHEVNTYLVEYSRDGITKSETVKQYINIKKVYEKIRQAIQLEIELKELCH